MKGGVAVKLTVVVCLCLALVPEVGGADDQQSEPIFLQWLVADDPWDQTIRRYWEMSTRGELSAAALVDLGTMLYRRGFSNDAVRMFRAALEVDPDFEEAWFRIGLIDHREGDLDKAREAYRRCLKRLVGHGWCNFYMGLLEEQTHHPSRALEHYEKAFQHAPELADPHVNPEVLRSKLQLGAVLVQHERERFMETSPLMLVEPEQVREVKRQFEPEPTPTPEPTPAPTVRPVTPEGRAAQSTPRTSRPPSTPGYRVRSTDRPRTQPPPRPTVAPNAGRDAREGASKTDETVPSGAGFGAPGVGSSSPQVFLTPRWLRPPDWIMALV